MPAFFGAARDCGADPVSSKPQRFRSPAPVDQQSVAGQDLSRSIDLAARGTERVADHIARSARIGPVDRFGRQPGSFPAPPVSKTQAATLRQQVQGFLSRIRAG